MWKSLWNTGYVHLVLVLLFTDRNVRIEKMKSDLKELEKQNIKLRKQDNSLRQQYDQVS